MIWTEVSVPFATSWRAGFHHCLSKKKIEKEEKIHLMSYFWSVLTQFQEEEEELEEEEEAVEVEEVEIVNVIQQKPTMSRVERITEVSSAHVLQPEKMDTRYFGELLADVYRKNCDIHTCISEHVAKIRGKSVGLLSSTVLQLYTRSKHQELSTLF